jgi:hypothetical protein
VNLGMAVGCVRTALPAPRRQAGLGHIAIRRRLSTVRRRTREAPGQNHAQLRLTSWRSERRPPPPGHTGRCGSSKSGRESLLDLGDLGDQQTGATGTGRAWQMRGRRIVGGHGQPTPANAFAQVSRTMPTMTAHRR